jgi:hypothetical protein
LPADHLGVQLRLDLLQPAAGVRHGEPGPIREVLYGGWPAAVEVPAGELGQGDLARHRPDRRRALIEERVGEVLAPPAAAANHAVQFGPHQQVAHAKLSVRVNSDPGQEKRHKTLSYQEELREFLTRHGVAFDERYVWE